MIKDVPKRLKASGPDVWKQREVAAGAGRSRGGAAKGRGWQWLGPQDPITRLFPYLAT